MAAVKPSSVRKKTYDVYISYHRGDREWVENDLIPELKRARLKYFLDTADLQPGDDWTSKLEQGIMNSCSILVVLSPYYLKSDLAQFELDKAFDLANQQETTLIPVLLRQTQLPVQFSDIQYVDFTAFERLEIVAQQELWKRLTKTIRAARNAQRRREKQAEAQAGETVESAVDASQSGASKLVVQPTAVKGAKTRKAVKEKIPGHEAETEIEVTGRALADTYSKKDLLGYQDYVEALQDFIESSRTAKPITIGIDAPWGGGKTTIMRMLERKLGPPPRLKAWQRENDEGEIEGSWSIFWENFKNKTGSLWHMLTRPSRWVWPWKRAQRAYFYVVWFNAWQYDQEESLWAAFVLKILEQVRDQLGPWRRIGLSLRLNRRRFKWSDFLFDLANSFLRAVLIAALGLGALWLVALASGDSFQSLSTAYLFGRINVIVGLGALSLIPFAYTLLKDVLGQLVSPFSLGISKYFKGPDYKNKIGFLGQFQSDFKTVVEVVTEKGKWPLLIFVDDLDRCVADKAASVIEAINLLLDSQHCVFVIGMDTHVLASSIQAKYKDLQQFFQDPDNPGGLSLGHKFLEKIIQINFRVPVPDAQHVYDFIDVNLGRPRVPTPAPPPNPAQRLLQAELRAGKGGEQAKQAVRQGNPEITQAELELAEAEIQARSFDESLEVQETVRAAAPYLEFNPRKIKRYINLYRLQALIAYRRGILEESVSLDTLGKWILIGLRWPEFFNQALEHPRLAADFFSTAKRYNKAKEAEKKAILASLSDPYLSQAHIQKLFGNQDLQQVLAGLPLAEAQVKNYLQLLQVSDMAL